MTSRAAVVIGLDSKDSPAPLRAAVSGAKDIAKWLEEEGFEVTIHVDELKPLSVSDLKAAVRTLVDKATLDQLVIYFAGHGFLNGGSEIWLLSGAPDDPNEAVDVTASAEFARACSIPSVVFISDACRSIPQDFVANNIRGLSIFPNRRPNTVDVEVDRFFATAPGDVALELSIKEAGDAYSGLFTEILKASHINPDPSIIRQVNSAGENRVVVPSRQLKKILPERVRAAAQARSIKYSQLPQLRLECGEDTFISRAVFFKHSEHLHLELKIPRASKPSLRRRGMSYMEGYPIELRPKFFDELRTKVGSELEFQELTKVDVDSSTYLTPGIRVQGAHVSWAFIENEPVASTRVGDVSFLPYDAQHNRPASASICFANGTGTVLAVLPGFVASVIVDKDRISNINYVALKRGPFGQESKNEEQRLIKLRTMVAIAARKGILATDRDDAKHLASALRRLKRLDPTLGIHAALTYAEFGLKENAHSVAAYMQRDHDMLIYDVALVADLLLHNSELPIAPFCPMLNQAWSYLSSRNAILPDYVAELGRHRISSWWSTYDEAGMKMLYRTLRGETR